MPADADLHPSSSPQADLPETDGTLPQGQSADAGALDDLLAAMRPEHRALFRMALAAYDANSLDTAQRLALQILAQDDHAAPAWLLLSYIEPNWYDQMQCAENALAVAPDLEDARLRVQQVKEQYLPASIGRPYSVIPAVKEAHREAMERYFREGALEAAVDPLDDPNQCPYCGVINGPRRRVCSNCHKSLRRLRPVVQDPSGALRMAWMLNFGAVVMVCLQLLTPLIWAWYIRLPDRGFVDIIFDQYTAVVIAGPVRQVMTPELFLLLLVLGVLRVVLLIVAQVALRFRFAWGYYFGVGLFGFETVWALFAAGVQWTGVIIAGLSALVAVSGLMSLVVAAENFPVVWERYRVQPDERLKSARAHWERGREHQRAGMWALALAEYRAAVAAAPNRADYYKSLGIGYNRLGHLDRALRALEQTQRLDPTDLEVATLVERLRAQMQAQAASRQAIVPLQPQGDAPPRESGQQP